MKKLKVNLIIKELYDKLLTSNVPTYLLSSQDKVTLGAMKTLKAKKKSITWMNIFVFWLKNKYLLARKEEILEAASKKEQVNNIEVVIIKGLKNVKTLVLSLIVESVKRLLLGKKIDVVEGDVVYYTNRLFQLVCNLSLLNNGNDALGVSEIRGLLQNTKVFSKVKKKATGNIASLVNKGAKAVANRGIITGDRVFSIGVDMIFEKNRC